MTRSTRKSKHRSERPTPWRNSVYPTERNREIHASFCKRPTIHYTMTDQHYHAPKTGSSSARPRSSPCSRASTQPPPRGTPAHFTRRTSSCEPHSAAHNPSTASPPRESPARSRSNAAPGERSRRTRRAGTDIRNKRGDERFEEPATRRSHLITKQADHVPAAPQRVQNSVVEYVAARAARVADTKVPPPPPPIALHYQ